MFTRRINPDDLAVAYKHVARVNHYLVGVALFDATLDDLCDAQQVLIAEQNALPARKRGRAYRVLDLALDLIERDISTKQQQAA